MNSVQSHPTASDNNVIAGLRLFFPHFLSFVFSWQKSNRTSKNQRLAAIARINCNESKWCRDSALITANIYPFNDSFKNTPRGKKRLLPSAIAEEFLLVFRVGDAETIHIRD